MREVFKIVFGVLGAFNGANVCLHFLLEQFYLFKLMVRSTRSGWVVLLFLRLMAASVRFDQKKRVWQI